MTENNYGIREIKNLHLKNIYKKYTDHIINFEAHIKRIFNDFVIDINNRNYILQQLDSMIRSMIKIYNTNLLKIYREFGNLAEESDTGSPLSGGRSHGRQDTGSPLSGGRSHRPQDTGSSLSGGRSHRPQDTGSPLSGGSRNGRQDTGSLPDSGPRIGRSDTESTNAKTICNYNSVYENIYEGLNIMELLEDIDKNDHDPFHEIKAELITLCKEQGFYSMDQFFKLYIGDKYTYLIDTYDLKIFDLYNRVFVPISITLDYTHKKNNQQDPSSNFIVTRTSSRCDSLIDNTCDITIRIDGIPVNVRFEGYVSGDTLNAYVRTSQIYSTYLFNIRTETKNIIKKSYTQIDGNFFTRYTKQINGNCYFVNSATELVEKIVADYHMFNELTTKNFNLVMKEFVGSDIKTMFSIINLLLMGTEQNVSTGVLLFNLLKDKKVSGEVLSDIIYHNLSYHSQIKIKKVTSMVKNELQRIRTLTAENISIEKRLAYLTNMPDNVKSYIMEKINEIKSGENNYKLQMAINGLIQFPWKPRDSKNDFSDIKKSMTKSRDYLLNVAKKLDEIVYGHENSKKVLIELVGKWIQNPESTGQVIGLVGPPGIGKTLLAKSISSALAVPLSIVGLGGMSDSADLIGHSFTYAGAQYGMIIRQMIKAGNWRCVMFFDEVDKVSKRNDTNEIYNTLIHITDPNMNQHFQDRFYSSSIEFDLSGVLIVFSYNDSSKLDPILLDRIKEINIAAYSTKEKVSIAQNYITKELCDSIGFDHRKISIDDGLVKYIIEKYTLEAGVRELRRKLEQILLKLNIDRFYMRGPFRELLRKKYLETAGSGNKKLIESDELSENNRGGLRNYVEYRRSKLEDCLDEEILNKIFNLDFDERIVISQNLVHKYLEKPTILVEEIHKTNLVGVVNGLYATTIGMGGIIPIQILKNFIGSSHDGTNLKLKLTGNQKQVMRESVICALTTAVNILNTNIKNGIMETFPNGFHIHAPDGGTPKDGPSAGCAFTTAFVSILLGKKINRFVAMTGEIELTGKVSKIGGLDSKLIGAKKAGVKCVYICDENREDYETIKKKIQNCLTTSKLRLRTILSIS